MTVRSASRPTPLDELAAYAGVMTGYEDAFGERQACPESSVRAILGAMGFDAATPEAAAATLASAREAAWRRVLEPIYVVPAGDPLDVSLSLRSDVLGTLEWTVVAEDGSTSGGVATAGRLAVLETATFADETYVRRTLTLPQQKAPGYYELRINAGGEESRAAVAAVPQACFLPPRVAAAGVWGLSAQLYALRSKRRTEIGDFDDLAQLCRIVGEAGGSAVGVNPLHELTFSHGVAPSPYCPSSRVYLNWIYLDVEALPGYERDAADEAAAPPAELVLIDYERVASAKRAAAGRAYRRFYEREIARATPDAAAFAAFVRAGGEALGLATAFDALSEHFARAGGGGAAPWQTWPAAFHDPASQAVAGFVREHAREVEFFAYLQWQADVQFAAAAAAGAAAGLAIGIYRDLAVGADLGGADTWTLQATLRSNVTVGAPPDLLNRNGQAWGVAPFDPLALRAAAYAPFIALLRANMRHAGALRIDHVMALTRLYWVPSDAAPSAGAYVSYRLDELLGLVALESERARCMVIGEDLGTVPAGFRERLERAGILSYRLLEFEQDDERFFAPHEYPQSALVATATHDLPSIGAYWTGHDIDVRSELGLAGSAEHARDERAERTGKRRRLLAALREAGLPERDARRFDVAATNRGDRAVLAEIALWANRFLSRTPSRLLMVQLEDVLGDVEQVNIPATTDEHPNWRRRASIDVDDLARDARFVALASALAGEGRSAR